MREWEATTQTGNWFGFFIDYKLKFQAVINILSLNYTCCTELRTHLYKMSCEAVARHKFRGAHDFQHVAFCKDPPSVLNMATDTATKCCLETCFPALFSCGPFSPPSPWILNKISGTIICESRFKTTDAILISLVLSWFNVFASVIVIYTHSCEFRSGLGTGQFGLSRQCGVLSFFYRKFFWLGRPK